MTKENIVFVGTLLISLVALTSSVAFETGKDKGRKEVVYKCPDFGREIEIISSAIILDENDNPTAITCSYLPAYSSYGKALIRIPGIIFDSKKKIGG